MDDGVLRALHRLEGLVDYVLSRLGEHLYRNVVGYQPVFNKAAAEFIFRIARGGAQEYFGVKPDLATFAKAIAGGFPMSCIAGRADVMDANLNASGTFNANPISVAASLNTLDQLGRPGVYENLNRITEMIVNGTYEVAKKHDLNIYCKNVGSIWLLQFGSGKPLSDLRDSYHMVDKEAYQKFEFPQKTGKKQTVMSVIDKSQRADNSLYLHPYYS